VAIANYRAGNSAGGTSGSGEITVALTPAVGDLFFVIYMVSGNTNDAPTCTDDNGGTYTLLQCAKLKSSADRLSVFVRNQLLTNTTSTTCSPIAGANTSRNAHVIAFSGMSKVGAAAIKQSAKTENGAAAGTPAVTLGASADTNNALVYVVGNGTNPAGMTTPTGFTERADTGQNTPSIGLENCTANSGITIATITSGSTSASAFGAIAVELDVGIAGALSKTLGALTSSAAGTLDIQGSSSPTLGALTLSSASALDIAGGLTKTLGALTLVSEGTLEASGIVGQLDVTLGALTGSSDATLDIAGQLAVTLGALGMSAAGVLDIAAAAAVTLGAAILAAAGTVDIAGAAGITLGDLVLASAADVAIAGGLIRTLGALALASHGVLDIRSALSITLGDLLLVADGTVVTGTVGELDVILGALTGTGAGTLDLAAALTRTLGPLVSTGAGSLDLVAAVDALLGSLTLAAACTLGAPPTRSIAVQRYFEGARSVESFFEVG